MRQNLEDDRLDSESAGLICEEANLPLSRPGFAVSRRVALAASLGAVGSVIGIIAFVKHSSGSRLSKSTLSESELIELTACRDSPADWSDYDGETCEDYAQKKYCTRLGQAGEGWNSAWGTFVKYGRDGAAAPQACCQCGGGLKDGSAESLTPAPSGPIVHTSPAPPNACSPGYTLSHHGWWDNYYELYALGKVINGSFVSSDECAAMCNKDPGCKAYTLFQDKVCWNYNDLGNQVKNAESVACTRQTRQTSSKYACSPGYILSHHGWWDNYDELQAPFGKVEKGAFVSRDECAAICNEEPGCIAYTLFQNKVCWSYNDLGNRVKNAESVACTKRQISSSPFPKSERA
jgi:hypothetical protein